MRLNYVDNIGFTLMQAHRLATTDPLTGFFTSVGIVDVAGTVIRSATSGSASIGPALMGLHDPPLRRPSSAAPTRQGIAPSAR